MSEHHKFRYLLPPGNNFNFVSKFRIWVVISILLMAASIGTLFLNKARHGSYMNWTIDFKGGTELIFAFQRQVRRRGMTPDPTALRKAISDSGEEGFDVSDISWTAQDGSGNDVTVNGTIVRTPRFSALKPEADQQALTAFTGKFGDREIAKTSWSGDRLFVRSKKVITNAEAAPVFAAAGIELKTWTTEETSLYTHADEGTGEFNETFSMYGLDRQFKTILEKALPGVTADPGADVRRRRQGRRQAATTRSSQLVYAIFLIMLYLAFRFDIRYAPGAAFATVHDAIMVIGVFALTWTEVSLTSVAGLLTVMGYSVNDTVIVFDRIRENQAKIKDKKIDRIIDISINEMLVRTILTSSTVFATTLIMNIFGTGLVKNFAFAMNIGVIVGTYSSIFLAAPLFMWVSKKWYSGPPVARRRAPVQIEAQESAPDPT